MQTVAGSWILVHRAQSLIERDSLMAELAAEGIEAETERKDMHNRLTSGSVDLAYDGLVSISFDGFPIKVSAQDAVRARTVIQAAVQKFESQQSPSEESSGEYHVRKFTEAGLFSIFLPIVMHVVAVYHMIKAIRLGGPIVSVKTFLAALILVLMAGALLSWGLMTFVPHFMRF